MPRPEATRKEIEAMPAVLRALLEAELASGNEIAEIGHTFPAPPVGAYFRLTKPLQTRAPISGDGVIYYDRNASTYSGEITDAQRFYFLLEPPHAPEPEPDMDAIREARCPELETANPVRPIARTVRAPESPAASRPSTGESAAELTPMQSFERSLVLDYEKWHDGIGYDLEALRAMSPTELKSTEAKLIGRGVEDWRDIEALACIKTPTAEATLRAAMNHANPGVRNAVMRYAPELVTDAARIASLVDALHSVAGFSGLRSTLDQVEAFHPAPIVEALLRGTLDRAGDVAAHFAAMLCFIHGQAPEPFDLAQRPFFLRFNTHDRAERETVFRELCGKIGVDAAHYLPRTNSTPPDFDKV